MYFIDNHGQFQLTGAGLLFILFIMLVFIVLVWEGIKKIFWYRREYLRLRAEVDQLEQEIEKNFHKVLEKYYQDRKRWEKNNGYY